MLIFSAKLMMQPSGAAEVLVLGSAVVYPRASLGGARARPPESRSGGRVLTRGDNGSATPGRQKNRRRIAETARKNNAWRAR
jgi:hypothetical protein